MASSSYLSATKSKYRITLEVEVFEDMNPYQIDWNKVLKLEPSERVSSYIEDLNAPDKWH